MNDGRKNRGGEIAASLRKSAAPRDGHNTQKVLLFLLFLK
jgi:hypothetical protein